MAGTKKQRLAVIVGANITARRKLLGWNQAAFAERLGMGADSLSRIERGLVAPRFQRLEEIAEILECSVAELFMTQEDLEKYRISFSSPKQEELPTVTRSEIIFLAERNQKISYIYYQKETHVASEDSSSGASFFP